MDTLMRITMCLLPLALFGCLGVSPEEARRRAIEDGLAGSGGRWEEDDDDGDEEHNPGTPCLACHDRDYNPGDDVFALAGTIFFRASDRDADGLAGVTVHLTDARGREMYAVSNDAGNFMFKAKDRNGTRVRVEDDGRTKLDFWPEFPIRVWIEQGGVEQRMLSPIRREGSCATCHDGDPSATSVGRVFLMESSP